MRDENLQTFTRRLFGGQSRKLIEHWRGAPAKILPNYNQREPVARRLAT
jgi:hypothetical protein